MGAMGLQSEETVRFQLVAKIEFAQPGNFDPDICVHLRWHIIAMAPAFPSGDDQGVLCLLKGFAPLTG